MPRYYFLLASISLGFFCCKVQPSPNHSHPENKALQLVHRTIKASGGSSRYNDMKSLAYKKAFSLLDSSGAVEKAFLQEHLYNYETQEFKIISIESGDTITSYIHGGTYSRYKNGTMMDLSQDAIARGFNSSLYVIGIPFKLLDEGVELAYFGSEKEADHVVDIISAKYDSKRHANHSSSEEWRYYISRENNLIIKNWVKSVDHFNLIENLEFENVEGLLFHKNRASYRLDSLGNKLFLRATYDYYDYKVRF